MHALVAERIINGLSGVFFIALGVLVLRVRAGGASNRAFALFAVPFGALVVLLNFVTQAGHSSLAGALLSVGLSLATVAGLVQVARVHLRETGHRIEVAPAAVAALWALSWILIVISELRTGMIRDSRTTVDDPLEWFLAESASAYNLVVFAFAIPLAAFTSGFGKSDEKTAAVKALMAAALGVFPAFAHGFAFSWGLGTRAGAEVLVQIIIVLVGFLVLVWAWLAHAARAHPPASAYARNVVLVLTGAMLAGLLEQAFRADALDLAGYGITRVACVGLLAYGIVRHQVMGIDLKLRWTLSKTTIAAAFIAVFFVASEGAQQFFGDTLGSNYVGIGAAGMLVFAMAPLQRVAERLAEKAVPVAQPNERAAPSLAAHEEAFKTSVRFALRGGITRREEMDLARIADAHQISALRAYELRDEVEREVDGASDETHGTPS